MRTLLERALSPVRNAINVAPLIRRVPSPFFFFSLSFFLFCFPPRVTRGNDVSGQEGTGSLIYIYIRFDLCSFESRCSAELDVQVARSIRRELGKAHDPLDLSNSRETVGKEVYRVYFA